MPNSNKHGPLLPGTLAALLGHSGNYYFQIYSHLHVQSFQRRGVLQNFSLVQLIVLSVSPWRCEQPSTYKGGVLNSEFLKESIKRRGLLKVWNNEAHSCLSHCHVEVLVNLKQS